jgi:hypothetical protein
MADDHHDTVASQAAVPHSTDPHITACPPASANCSIYETLHRQAVSVSNEHADT